jgi:hypothetical protein
MQHKNFYCLLVPNSVPLTGAHQETWAIAVPTNLPEMSLNSFWTRHCITNTYPGNPTILHWVYAQRSASGESENGETGSGGQNLRVERASLYDQDMILSQ